MDSWRVSLFGDRLHVITDDRNNEQTVRQKLKDGGINVVSAREARFSMEDVFISVVAQAQQRSMAARGH